ERADLEITAVSARAYVHLTDRYAVLASGASMGLGYGPVVVAREVRDLDSLRGRRGAIPGALTTAAPLLEPEGPECVPVEVGFDRIAEAVVGGLVDAGVIIHESQLTYAEEGLTKVVDFGELWQQREGLPVPLGLDVVRRDLGEPVMRAVSTGLRASIEAAQAHEEEALAYALGFGRGLGRSRGRRFVRMYVNDLTLDMGDLGRRALERLYSLAERAGVLSAPPRLDVI